MDQYFPILALTLIIINILCLVSQIECIIIYGQDRENIKNPCVNKSNLSSEQEKSLPTLVVKDAEWREILGENDIGQSILIDGNSVVSIHLECTAPYPVQFIFKSNEKGQLTAPKIGYNWSKVFYRDFNNKTSYTFFAHQEFSFVTVKQSQPFICESIDNPCLQKTLFYSFVPESGQLNFTMLNQTSREIVPMVIDEDETRKNSLDFNSHSPFNSSHCEARYYYDEEVSPGRLGHSYQFRCQFSDGKPGEIKQFPCGNRISCLSILRNRPLELNCWERFNPTSGKCKGCNSRHGLSNFIPSITVCTTDPKTQFKNGNGGYKETKSGTLVLYGVPQIAPQNQLAPIFFSDDEALKNLSRLIYLRDFDKTQSLNSNLPLECFALGYISAASFQFALEYTDKDKKKLEFLPPLSDEVQWNDPTSTRSVRFSLHLNRTDLTRIFCFAAIENTYNWLNTSRPVRVVPPSRKIEELPTSTNVILISVVTPLVIISGIIMAFLLFRIWRLRTDLRNLTDEEIRAFVNGYGNAEYESGIGFGDNNYYITRNPLYSSPFDTNFEIPRHLLELDQSCVLGSGQFGIVMKGLLKKAEDGNSITVAVKTVRKNVDVENFKALLSEIKIMSCLGRHENIIEFIGACTTKIREREILAAIEFCSNGDLRGHLREQRKAFPNLDDLSTPNSTATNNPVFCGGYVQIQQISKWELLDFAKGISNGMKFLTTKNVIHGDLATRNILLTDRMEIKISDFGLSKQLVQYSKYVKKQEVALPFKWMPPETLLHMEFSIKSDVWSFGVVLWEILSLGDDPYSGQAWSAVFLDQLLAGHRLQQPEFCTPIIYTLMLDCWKIEASLRPSFDDIHSRIIQEMTTLKVLPAPSFL